MRLPTLFVPVAPSVAWRLLGLLFVDNNGTITSPINRAVLCVALTRSTMAAGTFSSAVDARGFCLPVI
jgi:hypothetical protein